MLDPDTVLQSDLEAIMPTKYFEGDEPENARDQNEDTW